ncbi:Panacea domain-containing protein [Neorhizobium sp. AL 9.2.2]|uniref:Panacea domain-containing protein n=1 Tax=Neorhizobium sp. AL 9.2.2 TaxID=2712894 RepID=UPI0015D478A0|nr:Panacea domain-containing protein [Neorhizobium sp. AL 9.2.2]
MAYLIKHYPDRMSDELSNARLTKMVYLADWRHVLETGKQITNIDWYFDNYGPYVNDISTTAASNSNIFAVENTLNMYGQNKKKFALRRADYVPPISGSERDALDHIIDVTQKLYWNDFIKLVYSTHPIASSERYSHLNLPEKAREYQTVQKEAAQLSAASL